MSPYDVAYSRTFPVPVEAAFDTVLRVPLPEIFAHRYGAIPAITALADQDGAWGRVGQTRTVVMADGGRMVETLTSLDRPTSFGYRIAPVRGPMKALVRHADGRWAFAAAGAGTRITWSWAIEATNPLTARAMPLLGRFWRGYARSAFDEVETVLLRGGAAG